MKQSGETFNRNSPRQNIQKACTNRRYLLDEIKSEQINTVEDRSLNNSKKLGRSKGPNRIQQITFSQNIRDHSGERNSVSWNMRTLRPFFFSRLNNGSLQILKQNVRDVEFYLSANAEESILVIRTDVGGGGE